MSEIYSFKKHTFFIIYILIIFFLFPGVYYKTGVQYFDELLLHLFSFILIYFVLNKLIERFNFSTAPFVTGKALTIIEYLPSVTLAAVVMFISYHFYHLGSVPLIEASKADNVVDIALIRQAVTTSSGTGVNYISSFVIRALVPFFVVYSCIAQKKYFFIAWVICAIFYSLNLMQKSHIVLAFVPLVLFFLFTRKYVKAFLTLLIPVAGVYFLALITNPGKVSHEDTKVELTATERVNEGSGNIKNRLIIVPGKTVADWFRLIPSEYPYLHGCGYRFAKVFGCEYTEYSKVLYPRLYPHYAVKGLSGTVNVASFMYEYSNFGKPGLVLAAFIISILLLTVRKLFNDEFLWLMVFNVFPVLMLSSKSFTTLLFSGGWGLTILLFFVFRHKLIPTTTNS